MKKSVYLGEPAPDFILKTLNGEVFKLSEFRQNKNVILVFNRGFT